jgi:hypothetical protein
MKWFDGLVGSKATGGSSDQFTHLQRTAGGPYVIKSPRIGFLNLRGASAQSMLEEDKAALKSLFDSCKREPKCPPVCDVLMIYADVQSNGRLVGCSDGLRQVIQKSTAQIVIIASENEVTNCIAAGKPTGYGKANLVLTI